MDKLNRMKIIIKIIIFINAEITTTEIPLKIKYYSILINNHVFLCLHITYVILICFVSSFGSRFCAFI